MTRRRSANNSSNTGGTSPKRSRRSLPSDRSSRDHRLGGADQGGRQPAHGNVDDFREANRALHDISSDKESELAIESHDLHFKANNVAHHTQEYDFDNALIVRRGQRFSVTLNFAREFNKETDSIILQFTTGARPLESKGTVTRVAVFKDATEEKMKNANIWRGVVDEIHEKTVKVFVYPSCRAVIGWYSLYMETHTSCGEGEEKKEFTCRTELTDGTRICVLFNAWCEDDSVYMENDDHRNEYVMNEKGRIWTGRQCGRPWDFGQFESIVLEAALYLMDKAEISDGARSNPVFVTRMITALANSCDESGLLEGRWTDTYPKNSTVPWAWTGSVAIIEQFMKRKKPVCYGQCWVFSGLTTTLLRSLGIPTRSVTNFQSAHDTDASTTIDYHWGEDDKPLEELNNDSVWNFHVWNEAWFKRSDLPEGYGGWQAMDATPQETSEGVMQCGPASIQAIKEGNVYLGYDAKFIFSEVNGDKIHWAVKDDGTMDVIYREKAAIGQHISTKAVGSSSREDVTGHYKFPEGSKEERDAVHRAHRYSQNPREDAYDIPEADVDFKLDVSDSVVIGKPIDIKILLKNNNAADDRTVTFSLTAVVAFYTGVSSQRIGHITHEQKLPAGGDDSHTLTITSDEYMDYIKPDSVVKVFLRGRVKDTGRSYAVVDTFQLVKPDLTVKLPERATIGSDFDVEVSFTNPLDTKLTNNLFAFEAPGITSSHTVPHKKAIGPGEEVSIKTTLKARKSGEKELVVAFSSDQLAGMVGAAVIYISYGE